MKHSNLKLPFVAAILLLSCLLSGCLFDNLRSYDEISEYVNDNLANLEELVSDNNGFEESAFFDYKEYLSAGTIVESAYSYSSEIIEFSCGGTGLVTYSTYCGFYYSKNNTSYGLEFDDERQTVEKDGSVIYHNSDGISFVNTKRIRPHWFYYYMEWH